LWKWGWRKAENSSIRPFASLILALFFPFWKYKPFFSAFCQSHFHHGYSDSGISDDDDSWVEGKSFGDGSDRGSESDSEKNKGKSSSRVKDEENPADESESGMAPPIAPTSAPHAG
jgi:hypothetical protein